MKKVYEFTHKDRATQKLNQVGTMQLASVSTDRAELFFYGDIVSNTWQSYWYEEDKSPQDVVDFLADLDDYRGVDIYINSGGGSVHGGLAIYNILKRYSGEKIVRVDGIAASIASVIALAGDKVIIPKSAQFMIHKPWSWAMGDADELRKEAEALDNCQRAIMAIYMQHVHEGITEDQIAEMVNRETWLTGDQAAQYFAIEVDETAEAVAWAPHYLLDYVKHSEDSRKTTKAQDLILQLQLLKLQEV